VITWINRRFVHYSLFFWTLCWNNKYKWTMPSDATYQTLHIILFSHQYLVSHMVFSVQVSWHFVYIFHFPGWGVKPTPHLCLVLRSRMCGAILALPQYALMTWCSVKKKHRNNFTYHVCYVPYPFYPWFDCLNGIRWRVQIIVLFII
jgi:hypothetical protein